MEQQNSCWKISDQRIYSGFFFFDSLYITFYCTGGHIIAPHFRQHELFRVRQKNDHADITSFFRCLSVAWSSSCPQLCYDRPFCFYHKWFCFKNALILFRNYPCHFCCWLLCRCGSKQTVSVTSHTQILK